jgi:hypothetical protein
VQARRVPDALVGCLVVQQPGHKRAGMLGCLARCSRVHSRNEFSSNTAPASALSRTKQNVGGAAAAVTAAVTAAVATAAVICQPSSLAVRADDIVLVR